MKIARLKEKNETMNEIIRKSDKEIEDLKMNISENKNSNEQRDNEMKLMQQQFQSEFTEKNKKFTNHLIECEKIKSEIEHKNKEKVYKEKKIKML